MSELKPFRVEVAVEAFRDDVWRALTEPEEIRRWFGWEYDGLEEEIRFIFVDHATPVPPGRIELEGDQTIDLLADGPRTTVRICHGSVEEIEDAGERYDGIEEGWRAFLAQLRHLLERHPGESRRTLHLTGVAVPSAVLASLDATLHGRPWHASRFGWAAALAAYGRGLVVVVADAPLDAPGPASVQVTITTHGLDDAAFEDLRREWSERWSSLAKDAAITP